MSFLNLSLALIGLSTFGSLIRVIIGPTIWDRLLGLGLGASKITLGVILLAVSVPEGDLLDLALLFSVLGFLVTILLARFIERRGVV